jgi:hypothetical protein
MMNVISVRAHGILDYGTVAAFSLIPTIFKLAATPAYLCYLLAVIHLLMTVLTRFPLGIIRVIPLGVHKTVEAVVGPVLVVSPWILGFSTEKIARNVFISAGVVIFAVWLLSEYYIERRLAAREQA